MQLAINDIDLRVRNGFTDGYEIFMGRRPVAGGPNSRFRWTIHIVNFASDDFAQFRQEAERQRLTTEYQSLQPRESLQARCLTDKHPCEGRSTLQVRNTMGLHLRQQRVVFRWRTRRSRWIRPRADVIQPL